jgi:hypothetical protein
VYLDVESNRAIDEHGENHTFKLGWCCYVNYKKDRDCVKGQWNYFSAAYDFNDYLNGLTQEKEILWLFGHNVYYDLQTSEFYYYFRIYGWKLEFYYDSGLTYILVIRKGTRTIKAISSTNYFACKLKLLGDLVGIPKVEVDFNNVSDEELSTYCKRDVEILKKSMEYYIGFVRDNDLGKFSLTKSSQAMSAYRHRFMAHKICHHEEPDIVALERAAYHGGRTECHRFGEQPAGEYLSLDINSMYPYVMKNYLLPIRCIDYEVRPNLRVVKQMLEHKSVIAECLIDTNEPAYAYNNGEKLIFPVGRFKCYLCTGGLKYAFKNNHVLEIIQAAFYDQGYIFGDYIDYFYSLRKKYKTENNLIMDTLAKYFMNTLYGKFGEKNTIEARTVISQDKPFHCEEVFDMVNNRHWIEYSMFGVKVVSKGKREGKKSFVSIPAHITEYARFLIWAIISQIGYEKVLYCDTDSILINKRDLPNIRYPVHETNLGALKIEAEYKKVILNGCKHYICDKLVKIKGVPKTAVQVGRFVYTYPEFLRQNTHMRLGLERHYRVNYITKDVSPQYDKGTILADGSIVPFRLELSSQPVKPDAELLQCFDAPLD